MAASADPRQRQVHVHDSPTGHVAVVTLAGEHDISTTAELRRALLDVTSRRLVVVDLIDCTFLDSSAIGVLVATRKRVEHQGGGLVIVNAHGPAEKGLRILGVTHVIPCYDTEGRQRLRT